MNNCTRIFNLALETVRLIETYLEHLLLAYTHFHKTLSKPLTNTGNCFF